MRIARVFPTKTSFSPTDPHAYFGEPELFMPKYDEIHISVTFTWDIPKAERLASSWGSYGKVRVGGVAIDGESDKPFNAGMYLKHGITITSRGCPFGCSFCMVGKKLIEFDDFPEGNIVQDNNFIATSDRHKRLVYSMLKKQKGICFKGGIDKRILTKKDAEDMRSLSTREIWLACDQKAGLKPLKKAVQILNDAGFTRSHLYCYVLIGKDMDEERERLMECLRIGVMPFAQLYKNKDNSINYSSRWKRFAREWSRPAIIRSKLKDIK